MTRFAGRTALVTGASRGLGRAIAIELGAAGARVHVGFRAQAEAAAETCAEILAAGGSATPCQLDQASPTSVDEAMASLGSVDVVINNAAIGWDEPFASMSMRAFDDVVRTDLVGVFAVCRAVARPMMARRAGAIVNVVSVAGLRASPGQANYAAAKAGVVALTQTMAAELGPFGVRVNAVAPGYLDTGMALTIDRRLLERRTQGIPLRRLGKAREVASCVSFLASDEASYVTGHTFVVDGGLSL